MQISIFQFSAIPHLGAPFLGIRHIGVRYVYVTESVILPMCEAKVRAGVDTELTADFICRMQLRICLFYD